MLQPAPHTGVLRGTQTNAGGPEHTLPVAQAAPRNEPFGKHAFSEFRHDLPLGHLVALFGLQASKHTPPAASEQVSAALTLEHRVSPGAPAGQVIKQVLLRHDMLVPPGPGPHALLGAHALPGNEPLGKHEFSRVRHDKPEGHVEFALQACTQMPPAASEQVKAALTVEQRVSPGAPAGQSTKHEPLWHDMVVPPGSAPQTLSVAHALPGNEPFGKHAFSEARHDKSLGHLVVG
jgi:hypothetical protein